MRLEFKLHTVNKLRVGYLHGDLLDQVPVVRVIKRNTVLRGSVHNQLPQHGALLSDFFGQTAGVNSWSLRGERSFKIYSCALKLKSLHVSHSFQNNFV